MSRYSNPSSGLFGICAETLRRYSCPFTIPEQDAPRPLPSPLGFYLFSCRLEVSARGRGYRFGLLRRRGDILFLWRPPFHPPHKVPVLLRQTPNKKPGAPGFTFIPERQAHISQAGNETRTHDPFITSEVLYRLSYSSL